MKWVRRVTSLLLREIINSEKKIGTNHFMQRKTTKAMNNQYNKNYLEPTEITKHGQICITTLKRSSSHGKIMILKDLKQPTSHLQSRTETRITYQVQAW
jgi:hypothetical protein